MEAFPEVPYLRGITGDVPRPEISALGIPEGGEVTFLAFIGY